jgi:hypothetical protein
VTERVVEVLAIVAKAGAEAWLARHGEAADETAAKHGERKR